MKFEEKPGEDTMYEPLRYIQTQASPLLPFFKIPKPSRLIRGTPTHLFWTSEDVTDWRVYNYDYEAFQNPSFIDTGTNLDRRRSPDAVMAWVDRYYKWTTPLEKATVGINRPPPRAVSGYPCGWKLGGAFSQSTLVDKGTPWPSPECLPVVNNVVFATRMKSSAANQNLDQVQDLSKVDPLPMSRVMQAEASPLAHIIEDGTLREWDAMVRFEK